MRLFTARNKATAAVVAVATISLTACSSDSADDTASSPDQASTTSSLDAGQPASRALSDLIVDASLTPEGFEYLPPTSSGEPSMAELLSEFSELADGAEGAEAVPEDPEGLLAGQPLTDVSTTTPTQCTGLALDTLSVVEWMMLPTDTNATAGYGNLANDDDAIMITLTSNPVDPAHYPADLSQCAEFTRTMEESGAQASSTFSAAPSPVSIDNAEVLASANVTLTGAALNDQPVDGEGVNTTVTMITATTGGITFTLVAPETTDPALITSIAAAQAERITNAPAA